MQTSCQTKRKRTYSLGMRRSCGKERSKICNAVSRLALDDAENMLTILADSEPWRTAPHTKLLQASLGETVVREAIGRYMSPRILPLDLINLDTQSTVSCSHYTYWLRSRRSDEGARGRTVRRRMTPVGIKLCQCPRFLVQVPTHRACI